MRARFPSIFLLSAIFLAPGAFGHGEGDFHLSLTPGDAPGFVGENVTAVLVREEPGTLLEWNLVTSATRLVGEIDLGGYFDVARAKQALPLADDRYFTEVRPDGVDDAAEWARILNVSGEGATARYRLAFPVEGGNATLTLKADVTPPGFDLGEPANLTHFSFYLETTTDEHAFATLVIREADGSGDPVLHPTPQAALVQRFPVQGLDADADHAFHVEFVDWSGNQARSEDVRVRTLPVPDLPSPVITAVEPVPNATVPSRVRLGANFTNPEGEISHVRFILDKRPLDPATVPVETGRLSYLPPAPLAPGIHTVRVEITNSLGGATAEQWKFVVEGAGAAQAPGLAAAGVLALLAGAALAGARSRRE